jgi:hypothetical protein
MVINVHVIDKNWKSVHFLLDFFTLPHPHYQDNLCDSIQEVNFNNHYLKIKS